MIEFALKLAFCLNIWLTCLICLTCLAELALATNTKKILTNASMTDRHTRIYKSVSFLIVENNWEMCKRLLNKNMLRACHARCSVSLHIKR